ncbi:hypothetical protein GOBAR_AA13663 [Gossypium barbadense]|uniref:Uncharacterized protein n=1 Tax=Gossypium barbadense TaxID=3634 RepID=A0A2P5XUI0_GOSBA|nr:hypothetical protein GOBAR_AA13663 [Gossypium barbadense]
MSVELESKSHSHGGVCKAERVRRKKQVAVEDRFGTYIGAVLVGGGGYFQRKYTGPGAVEGVLLAYYAFGELFSRRFLRLIGERLNRARLTNNCDSVVIAVVSYGNEPTELQSPSGEVFGCWEPNKSKREETTVAVRKEKRGFLRTMKSKIPALAVGVSSNGTLKGSTGRSVSGTPWSAVCSGWAEVRARAKLDCKRRNVDEVRFLSGAVNRFNGPSWS